LCLLGRNLHYGQRMVVGQFAQPLLFWRVSQRVFSQVVIQTVIQDERASRHFSYFILQGEVGHTIQPCGQLCAQILYLT
jgi:hypothetical protein